MPSKSSGAKDGKDKISKLDLIDYFVEAMKGNNWFNDWPDFSRKFHKLEDMMSMPSLYEELPGEVIRPVSGKGMVHTLLDYSRAAPPEARLRLNDAKEIVEVFTARSKGLDETAIAVVREKSQPGKCWHRLPWDLVPGATPVFDEIMSRMTNASAFMAWIGSLLLPETDRQDYVWMHGSGQNGKSSLARFLRDVFGPSYRAEAVIKGDKFWSSGLIGARLVVFPDCNDAGFPSSGLFKSLTGDDLVRCERKNEPSFTAHLTCKMMFLSNEKPTISGSAADLRRAIYCELAPLPEGVNRLSTRDYQSRLWLEGAQWLWKCVQTYREVAVGGSIPTDESATEGLIAANEEGFQTTFDRYFVSRCLVPGASGRDQPAITSGLMQSFFRDWRWDQPMQRKWYAWLERKYQVKRAMVRVGETTEWRYVGMVLLPAIEKELAARVARF